jgi:diguanylate cyclase (GGDEF)-like protein/PAS domain S-box-containing protein
VAGSALVADGRGFWDELARAGPPRSLGSLFVGAFLLSQVALTLLVERRARNGEKSAEDALRESEQRFRDLYENATDIIFTIDLEGRFTSINKAAERTMGYTAREALRMTIDDVLPPEGAEQVRQSIASQLGGEAPRLSEVAVLTKDGRKVPLEVKGRLLFNNGVPVGIQGIGRDVTDRERAEQLMQDRHEVLQLIAEDQPLDDVLMRLVGIVERHLPDGMAAVLRSRDGRVEIEAAPGLPRACLAAWKKLASGPGQCASGTAAYRKASVSACAIAADSLWEERRAIAMAHGLRGCVAVPVLSSHNVRGSVEVFYRSPYEASPFELDVLETAAELASIAFEHQELKDSLAHQAHHDPLTELPNRLLFEDRLQNAISGARRHRRTLGVLYVDLDRFKLVNDTLGHATGDHLLKQVARRFSRCLRQSDTLARTGGDEFSLVLPEIDHHEGALLVAEKLVNALKAPVRVGAGELFVSASIGIALYPEDGEDAATLQRKADTAMYFAKNKGGGRAQRYTGEIRAITEKRLAIENDLHRALERNELSLHYQPQFDLATGRMTGFEALLRWIHPELGPIPPNRFIPIAEESGLIAAISNWVLEEACAQNRRWQVGGFAPVRIAVNIPASLFSRSDLVSVVARVLCNHKLDSPFLELELTESAIMQDVAGSINQMSRLRALGVRIAIDDFGTGYSSLSYLQSLPVDNLKIDQSFLQVLDETGRTGPVIQAIVDLAHGLGLTVTAEGVELESQLNSLRQMGCDTVQGFWMGRPMPAGMATELLAGEQIPAIAALFVGALDPQSRKSAGPPIGTGLLRKSHGYPELDFAVCAGDRTPKPHRLTPVWDDFATRQ